MNYFRKLTKRAFYEFINVDEFVKSRNFIEYVIPAKAGIQLFHNVLDPGACPGPDPGFAGETTQKTFYETINLASGIFSH